MGEDEGNVTLAGLIEAMGKFKVGKAVGVDEIGSKK